MKIFAAHDGTGCGYYRVLLPLEQMAQNGHEVQMATHHDVRVNDYLKGDFDVFIGQRINSYDGLKLWRRTRKPGNRLVYENDDDVFSVGMDNWMAYSTYQRGDVREAVRSYCTVADLVTVTSEYLADTFREHNRNVAVLPNFIPGFVLDLPRDEPDGRLRVGWCGGASHMMDIPEASPSVRRFIRRNPGWDLRTAGQDYRATFKVPADRATHAKWIQVNDDRQGFYRQIDFDIGIAPLLDGVFARSKSWIKALEYGARGIPVVASAVGPYNAYIQHGYNGFLVKKEHEWLKYLEVLANDEDLRLEMGRNGKELAAQNTIEGNWQLWEKAYSSLFGVTR